MPEIRFAPLSIAEIAGVLMMLGGAIFLIVAAVGVLRLSDAFQRMHSATKAGTLGAMLTVIGAGLAGGDFQLSTGMLTILFLLITIPVSAQLLGRAAYVSGATIARLVRPDPLEEVEEMERQESPLEERIARDIMRETTTPPI